jgi:hypothetical protein
MTKTDVMDIGAIIGDGRLVDEAIAAAHAEVVRRHRQLGVPIVIWRDGHVAEVSADEFELFQGGAHTGNP